MAMIRRLARKCMMTPRTRLVVGLAVLGAGGVGLFTLFQDVSAYARDIDRCVHCSSRMMTLGKIWTGQDRSKMDPSTTIAEAAANLVVRGVVGAESLRCAIKGTPFQFRGAAADLGRSDAALVVIVYEPIESHHRQVGVSVMFANGHVRSMKRDELEKVVGRTSH